MWQELSVQEYQQWRVEKRPHTLLDVREAWEIEHARIGGEVIIPMNDIPLHQSQIAALEKPVVVICHAGVRSAQVAAYLAANGIEPIHSLSGGIHAFAQEIDPNIGFY